MAIFNRNTNDRKAAARSMPDTQLYAIVRRAVDSKDNESLMRLLKDERQEQLAVNFILCFSQSIEVQREAALHPNVSHVTLETVRANPRMPFEVRNIAADMIAMLKHDFPDDILRRQRGLKKEVREFFESLNGLKPYAYRANLRYLHGRVVEQLEAKGIWSPLMLANYNTYFEGLSRAEQHDEMLRMVSLKKDKALAQNAALWEDIRGMDQKKRSSNKITMWGVALAAASGTAAAIVSSLAAYRATISLTALGVVTAIHGINSRLEFSSRIKALKGKQDHNAGPQVH